jgi:hypothetical protein
VLYAAGNVPGGAEIGLQGLRCSICMIMYHFSSTALHAATHSWTRLLFRAHHHQQNMFSCTIWQQALQRWYPSIQESIKIH